MNITTYPCVFIFQPPLDPGQFFLEVSNNVHFYELPFIAFVTCEEQFFTIVDAKKLVYYYCVKDLKVESIKSLNSL